ncbi:MAG: hypothetical protein ACTSQF_09095 [Candidatus Heimdallarchaeaceae archaeon]
MNKHDPFRRDNLLTNARLGVGKVIEKDGDVILRLGTESYGFVVYTIKNATLAIDGNNKQSKE